MFDVTEKNYTINEWSKEELDSLEDDGMIKQVNLNKSFKKLKNKDLNWKK